MLYKRGVRFSPHLFKLNKVINEINIHFLGFNEIFMSGYNFDLLLVIKTNIRNQIFYCENRYVFLLKVLFQEQKVILNVEDWFSDKHAQISQEKKTNY